MGLGGNNFLNSSGIRGLVLLNFRGPAGPNWEYTDLIESFVEVFKNGIPSFAPTLVTVFTVTLSDAVIAGILQLNYQINVKNDRVQNGFGSKNAERNASKADSA